ncbi:NAD(P)-dependent oxidoreductase [Streptomyces sp. NPDC059909]|uniref:NAD(P)-dependent oxidoreductase n=1 Tax=Streptomyces sp. NPDC059909 TaxID=3346998 RepID=UPI003651D403
MAARLARTRPPARTDRFSRDKETDMAAQKTTVVGVLGAGRMGMPIIGHLIHSGFEVLVYDVDAGKEAAVAEQGARFVSTAAEIAAGCDTVMVCVGYEEQLHAMMHGSEGMLGSLNEGAVIAVLSTVSPEAMQELSEEGAKHGLHVVDAPVCRGSWAADRGELLSLLGGTEEATERFTEVARAYSADIVRLGDIGSGQVGKAINNLILWACLVANHEGLALAKRYGVDIDVMREALKMSSADNHALGNWNKQTMAWAEDDMKIVQEMAVNTGISLPQAAVNREICRVLKPRRYDLDRYGI